MERGWNRNLGRRGFNISVAGALFGMALAPCVSKVKAQSDTSNGDLIWISPTEDEVWSSPTVVNNTVFVGSNDGKLYAVDTSDGNQKWEFDTGNRVTFSPTVADGKVYFGNYDSNVYALNALNGTEVWSFETGDSVVSSPTVTNGTVYIGSHDSNIHALDAGVSGSSDGSRVMLGTLGHRRNWRYADQSIRDRQPSSEDNQMSSEDSQSPAVETAVWLGILTGILLLGYSGHKQFFDSVERRHPLLYINTIKNKQQP